MFVRMCFTKQKGSRVRDEDYRVAMYTLLFLRCLNKGVSFYLGSHVEAAGFHCDLVLLLRPKASPQDAAYQGFFIKVKHADAVDAPLGRGDAMLTGFQDLHAKLQGADWKFLVDGVEFPLEDATYVVMTNAALGASAVPCETQGELRLFQTGRGGVVRFLAEDVPLEADMAGRLRLFYDQTPVSGLRKLLEIEIQDALGDADVSPLYHRLACELRECYHCDTFLTEKSPLWKELVLERVARLNLVRRCGAKHFLRYTRAKLAEMRGWIEESSAVTLLPARGRAELSVLRVCQTLADVSFLLLADHTLVARIEEVLRLWRTAWCDVLVVEAPTPLPADLEDRLKDVLDEDTSKRLVVVRHAAVGGGDTQGLERWKVHHDHCTVDDFTAETRMKLLEAPGPFKSLQ